MSIAESPEPRYSNHSINIYGMNEKMSECTYRLKVIKQQNVRWKLKSSEKV